MCLDAARCSGLHREDALRVKEGPLAYRADVNYRIIDPNLR